MVFLFFLCVEAFCMLHALPSQTVFDILPQQHNKLYCFISEVMEYFSARDDLPQIN